MKRIFKISVLMSALVLGLAACSVEGPGVSAELPAENKTPQMSEDVVSGELLVRFDARVSTILEKEGLTKSGINAPATRSGVLSVDEILSLVEGYEIERVFPVDARSEEKAREAGLHLWYVVRFSEDAPVDQVAADLSKLGEVSRVSFNRTLKRASTQKAKPLTAELVRQLTSTRSTTADPLYGFQWNLDNDGSLQEYLEGATVNKFAAGADIRAEEAWAKCTGHPDIIVAVLDEGVDVNHPDLAASMWINEGEVFGSVEDADGNGYAGDLHGYNFVKHTGKITVNDRYDSGHGSHVAGAVAARNNNGIGIKSIAGGDGSADSGVRIMSCQIFSGQYVGTLLDEVRAIKYAADNGAVILQCSWGYTSGAANPYDWGQQFASDEEWELYNPLEKVALDYFVENAGSAEGVIEGGIAVFAGGNESAPAAGYPGAYGKFVSVAGIAGDYTPAIYSNYGPGINISAPGGDQDYYFEFAPKDADGKVIKDVMGSVGCILSTIPEWHTDSQLGNLDGDFKGYGYMEGTSMACPQVSGVIALGLSYALQQRKHFKAEEFIELLYSSATEIPETVFDAEKFWYKYVIDMGDNHPNLTPLKPYKGQMGSGVVNAAALLAAIDGTDAPVMTFPNVTLAVGSERAINPAIYFENGSALTYTVSVADQSVASAMVENDKVLITAKTVGQTTAVVKGGQTEQKFVITVRNTYNGNGWL